MRFDDLPPALKAHVREKAGMPEPRKKDRKGATRSAIDGHCHTCGEHFTRERDWERHTAENPGHRRLELVAR